MPQTKAARQTARRRAATSMAANELAGDVARRLGEHEIAVMPLKGVLLQHWLYDDPIERPLSDVDLLVHPSNWQQAANLLESAGYRPTRHTTVGGVVMETRFGLLLDLHSQVFDETRYRMTTGGLFARGTHDTALFGAAVRLPSPLDVYAHLIGKFGSDHLDARSTARLDEIQRMGSRLQAPPATTAQHLIHCGMRRVSLYVLRLVHDVTGDAFARQVIECLPSDPIGRVVVALAHPLLAGASPRSRTGALMAHLMNDSLPRGIRSGFRALRQHARG